MTTLAGFFPCCYVPVLVRCCQHRTSTGAVLATNGMFTGYVYYLTTLLNTSLCLVTRRTDIHLKLKASDGYESDVTQVVLLSIGSHSTVAVYGRSSNLTLDKWSAIQCLYTDLCLAAHRYSSYISSTYFRPAMTDHSKEASCGISALSVNVPMRNLRFVRQCIDGHSGDYALVHWRIQWMQRKLPLNDPSCSMAVPLFVIVNVFFWAH